MIRILQIASWFILMSLSAQQTVWAQCPTLLDNNGTQSSEPTWYNCSGEAQALIVQAGSDWADALIDWGDGTTPEPFGGWIQGDEPWTHDYPSDIAQYTVTVSEPSSGCIIFATLIVEEAASASLQIPFGGSTQGCAPVSMQFTNSSTNVSPNTTFTWNFGDGSGHIELDHTNAGVTLNHLYAQGTTNCETTVTLTAENSCNVIQGSPSTAIYYPIHVWDLDEAQIEAQSEVLCFPDMTTEFTNTTVRNCLNDGNIAQRFEYWNLGDLDGDGTDEIVDWAAWPPADPVEATFPGLGSYEVMMVDSSFCGVDTAYTTIEVINPPVALIASESATVCAGSPLTFYQQSENADEHSWNFGVGTSYFPTGSGNVSYTFQEPGIYTVSTAIGLTGMAEACRDTAYVTVEVLSVPQIAISMSETAGCDELTTVATASADDALAYAWAMDAPPYIAGGQVSPAIFYDELGPHPISLTVIGTNGCNSSEQVIVHVYPSPVADFVAANVCEGDAASFTDLSVTSGGQQITGWNWQFGDGTESFSQHTDHVYTETGNFDVTLTIQTDACSVTTAQSIQVEPAPVLDLSADVLSGCAPLQVAFSAVGQDVDSYAWNFGDNNGSGEQNPSHIFTSTDIAGSSFEVVATAVSLFGCTTHDTLTVETVPGALASFTTNAIAPDCAPFVANFVNSSEGASSYAWNFGDGNESTDFQPAHTYENTTGFLENRTIELIAFADNGCHDTTSIAVSVFPQPDYNFTLDVDSACAPLTLLMPNIEGVAGYTWAFGDGTTSNEVQPTHIWDNATEYVQEYSITLMGISPFGCVDSHTEAIHVKPQPTATFSKDEIAGCAPFTVALTNNSLQADTYTWAYGDGHEESFPNYGTHDYTYNGEDDVATMVITLTAMDDAGCFDSKTDSITVYPSVQAVPSGTLEACSPLVSTFTNEGTQTENVSWDFGTAGTYASHSFVTSLDGQVGADLVYDVSLNISSMYGCADDSSFQVTVHPIPVVGLEINALASCSDTELLITNLSSGSDSTVFDFGNGTLVFQPTSDSLNVVYENTTADAVDYQITQLLYTDHGCTNTASIAHTVYPRVEADFSFPTSECAPFDANFESLATNATQGVLWSFGDGNGSTDLAPVHVYDNPILDDVTYTVEMIATSTFGCADTAYADIEVRATPIASLEIADQGGCYPLDVTFANNSAGAASIIWQYGTGEISQIVDASHVHSFFNTFDQPITYTTVMTALSESGCSATASVDVHILPEIEANFDVSTAGCSPLDASFVNSSQGAETYMWSFGDEATSLQETPLYTFYNESVEDTTYTVQLIATSIYGCSDTTSIGLQVLATPEASFNVSPVIQTYPNATVAVTNTSSFGATAVQSWTFGDGSEVQGATPEAHVFSTWGTYFITLNVNNGACADAITEQVQILPPAPIADFTGGGIGCAPLTVAFQNTTEYGASYIWHFGDGSGATEAHPVHTFETPGVYHVALSATGFGGDTDEQVQYAIIEVLPAAQPAFSFTPSSVIAPDQPVTFINLSTDATEYLWDFGDGYLSTEENPTYTYTTPGEYEVTLTATNEFGCEAAFTAYELLHAQAGGYVVFPSGFTPSTTGAGDGTYDPTTFDNDVFHPQHAGCVKYDLVIFNKWGELIFRSENPNLGWDGYVDGQLARQDVYIWKVNATFSDGHTVQKAGDVTLIIH